MRLNKIITILSFTVVTLGSALSLANSVEDSVITAEVKAKLAAERDIPADSISVTTNDRVVRLTGTVDTRLQANHAIELVSSIDKVSDVVDSDLKVKESKSLISDSVTTAKVKGKIRHLHLQKEIAEGYDLHVETTDGAVHILGKVLRQADLDTVISAAKQVKGVKSVKTNIAVGQ